MLSSTSHDGYAEFDIPPVLQVELDAADTTSASTEAEKVPRGNGTLILYRYPPDPQNLARQNVLKKLVELLEPVVTKWPGKEDLQFEWQFKELRLERGGLITPTDSRNVFIPRPLPPTEKSIVTILIKKSRSQKVVEWDCSKAYLLEPDNSIFVPPHDSKPCRMWLLTFRYKEKDKEEVNRDAGNSGRVVGQLR
ncbi:uncharacterized protein BKA55DRAFT_696881 [Fusarium redolens]|uniref:Uncharacterized protein n=1 Tax=Fusarium redolens TaxID=48865 RepID=A0A9P9FY24_FUSRE|nr:uncharacterized protein BKA55DRAFT_696881 [Fusarium redolens]KAH7228562.1 hypothetical protein BKA55DRAFT_696881 [Fusarium redolens]